jgi:hypothetical protein
MAERFVREPAEFRHYRIDFRIVRGLVNAIGGCAGLHNDNASPIA